MVWFLGLLEGRLILVFLMKGVVAGSPQSTLCTMGTWSSSGLGSSSGSSNGPSQVPSPTSATPLYEKEVDAWELLYAAAGQVVRMKMNDETLKFHNRGVLGSPRKLPSAASLPMKPQSTASLPVKPQSTGFYDNLAVNHQQFNIHQVRLSSGFYLKLHIEIDHDHHSFGPHQFGFNLESEAFCVIRMGF